MHNIVYIITTDNIQIKDSYLINKKKEMRKILQAIKDDIPDLPVFKRSMFSLVCEWKAHNRLYYLGLWKSHTKHVDLEANQKWYLTLLYCIIGI